MSLYDVRILVLTHRLPFPPNKGDRIRSFNWIQALANDHEVDLITLEDARPKDSHLKALRKYLHNLWVFKNSKRTAPFRMFKSLITGKSLTEGCFSSKTMQKFLAQRLSDTEYDLIIAVCSSAGVSLLKAAVSQRITCKVFIDLVDVDSEKWKSIAEGKSRLTRWLYLRESRKIATIERQLAKRANKLFVISQHEADYLKCTNSIVLPNPIDTDYFYPSEQTGQIDSLVFVGQMDYFPNVQSVLWFAKNVWPLIHAKYPYLKWNIVGREPSRGVRRLGNLPNVIVTGEVRDIRPYFRSAIAVIPIRLAFGIQNKVLQALSAARPVITTTKVAGHIGLTDKEELLLADTPTQWIDAVETLITDSDVASKIGIRGREVMAERFSQDAIFDRINESILRDTQRKMDKDEVYTELETVQIAGS